MILVLWAILLIVVALCLPVAAWALHRLWKNARNIERYLSEMHTAARGIASHTAAVAALDDTISGAAEILSTASSVDSRAKDLHSALAARVGGENR